MEPDQARMAINNASVEMLRIDVGYWERPETSAAMQEARSSYVHGNFIATLVLALAYVEHVINDVLPPPKKRAPSSLYLRALRARRSLNVSERLWLARLGRRFHGGADVPA